MKFIPVPLILLMVKGNAYTPAYNPDLHEDNDPGIRLLHKHLLEKGGPLKTLKVHFILEPS